MVTTQEDLFVKSSDLTHALADAGNKIDRDASFIILSTIALNGKPYGTAYIGGNNDLLHDSIINIMLRDDAAFRLFTEAVSVAITIKQDKKS